MQTFLDSKHIAKDNSIPSYVNECQILDTHDLSYSNSPVLIIGASLLVVSPINLMLLS